MIIQLNGYGLYKIDEKRYNEFIEILNLENDLFLDIMQIQKEYEIVPILSINIEHIEKEGPVPSSHRQTEIGAKRMGILLERKIIASHGQK